MSKLTTRIAAVLALVLLAGAGVALLFGEDDTLTITADFTKTTGLYRQNDVTVLGIKVGEVTSIKADGPVVRVTMEVEKDVPIPADPMAVIMQRSLVTDRYVELTPSYADGPRLEDDTHLPLSRTRSPIGADDVFAAVNRLLEALDNAGSDSLAELVHASARNFDGNGAAVKRIITSVRQLMAVGADSADDLAAIVDGLDSLTSALAKRDALVNRFSTNLTEVTVQFARDRKPIARTVKELSGTMRFLADFVRKNQDAIGRDISQIIDLGKTLTKREAQLNTILKVTPQAFDNIPFAVNQEGRLIVNANAAETLLKPQIIKLLCDGPLKNLCADIPGPFLRQRTSSDVPLSLRDLLGSAR